MKWKRTIIAAVAAVGVCMIQACGGKDPVGPDPKPTPPEPEPEKPTLELTLSNASGTVESASVDAEGGTLTLTVKTNQAWTASTDADWLKAEPSHGDAGTVSVRLTAEANPSAQERSGQVTVKTSTLSRNFTVSQPGRDPEEVGAVSGDLGGWGDGGDANFNKQN